MSELSYGILTVMSGVVYLIILTSTLWPMSEATSPSLNTLPEGSRPRWDQGIEQDLTLPSESRAPASS